MSSTQTTVMDTEASAGGAVSTDASLEVDFDNFADIDDLFTMAEVASHELDNGILSSLDEPMVQVSVPTFDPEVPTTAVAVEFPTPATTIASLQQPIATEGAEQFAGIMGSNPPVDARNTPSVANNYSVDPHACMLQQPMVNQRQTYPHAHSVQGALRERTLSSSAAGPVPPGRVQLSGDHPHAQSWQGNQPPAHPSLEQPMGFPPSQFRNQHMGLASQAYPSHSELEYPPQHQLFAQQQFAMPPAMAHSRGYQPRMFGSGTSARASPLGQANAFRARASRENRQTQYQQRAPQHASHQYAHFDPQSPAHLLAHGINPGHSPRSGFPLSCDPSHPLNQRQPSSLCWWPPRVATNLGTKTPNFPVHPPYQPENEQIETASGPPVSPYPEPAIANSSVPAYGSPTMESVRLATALAADGAGDGDNTIGAVVDITSPSQFLDDQDAVPARSMDDVMAREVQVVPHAPPMAYGQPGGYAVATPLGAMNAQGYTGPMDAVDQIEDLKVVSSRALKKKGDPRCDPSRVYTAQISRPYAWGPTTTEGCPLFSYTKDGKLSEGRSYSTEELRLYVESGRAIMWLQQAPSQVASRLGEDDNKCRWEECPVIRRVISSGWLRVAFDEMPILTTDGTKDPFKYACLMHLWCFEQCFDPTQFYESRRLRPEIRTFPKEAMNSMSLHRDADREIVHEAYDPWFLERLESLHTQGPRTTPREHKDSLSWTLTNYHLNNQTSARQKARKNRNQRKPVEHTKTIDVHEGDLAKFIRISRDAKAALRREKSRLLLDSDEFEYQNGKKASGPVVQRQVQLHSQSSPSGNDTVNTSSSDSEQREAPQGHGIRGISVVAAEDSAAASGDKLCELLSPSGWQDKAPPVSTRPEYYNPLASFVARQASSPVLSQATTTIVGSDPSSPSLASAVVANINRTASRPTTTAETAKLADAASVPEPAAIITTKAAADPSNASGLTDLAGALSSSGASLGPEPIASVICGTRASKRKRSDADSLSEERNAKIQHIDKTTSKRKRGGSDETPEEVNPKRQRTDSHATGDSGISEAADGDVIVQPSVLLGSPLEDLFGEDSIGSETLTAAAGQVAASAVNPTRVRRRKARRSAR